MIERASGSGDDDIGAAPQGADLLIHGRAAVDRHDAEPEARGILLDGAGHLHREFPRRNQHQPP
jgi:hypothetical protein